MRKFGIKYSKMHPDSGPVRDAFVAVHRPSDWPAVLEHWYAEDLPGRWPAPDDERELNAASCDREVYS
jgi:tRNA-dihydrouridine synthase B